MQSDDLPISPTRPDLPVRLSDNARTVLAKRYLIKDETGTPIETPEDLYWRVATVVAAANDGQEWPSPFGKKEQLAEAYYKLMAEGRFLPNSPTLMNAGRPLGQLSACFVLPVEDALSNGNNGIYDTLRSMALIHQSGGGTGFSFSRLRPKGSTVRSTTGAASGPVSFMKLYDASTEVVKQGGTRRGANMGILRVDHPDILEFIDCKQDLKAVTNFNISVAVTTKFMEAVKAKARYDLIHPVTEEVVGSLDAAEVWDRIIHNAWRTGEPGVFFIDEANRYNPVPHLGSYEATNPCWTGDTKVWTIDGPRTFEELAATEQSVRVLTQDKDGKLCFRWMHRPHRTAKNATVVRVHLDTNVSVRCTPNHKFVLKDGSQVEAQHLRPGDRLASVYRYPANTKGYLRLSNGKDRPLEHVVVASAALGRRPEWPAEHVHHRDKNRQNNRPDNLEVVSGSEHNRHHMLGAENPMYQVWDARNPLFGRAVDGENNPRYRDDIVTDHILALRAEGVSLRDIAASVGCSKYTVQKRLGWTRPGSREAVANHKVVAVEVLSEQEDVYNGMVEETHTYFVVTGDNDAILSANCGEQPLLPYDVCNLGSINVGFYVRNGEMHWGAFEKDIKLATLFLDNVIDANKYPLPEIDALSKRIRRIGLGVMGFADALVRLGIPYDSPAGVEFGRMVMAFVDYWAKVASAQIAVVRGSFAEWEKSIWGPDATCARDAQGNRIRPMQLLRNCNVTTVAPTGTISLLAGCSSGLEPLFAVAFMRNQAGALMPDVNEDFVKVAKAEGWYTDELMERIAKTGSVKQPEVPERWQRIFVTANEISPEMHVRMQAAFQAHCDSAISKTTNFANSATPDDVRAIYELAYELKCKGVTVYRDGSREGQVLSTGATGTPTAAGQDAPEYKKQLADLEKLLAEKTVRIERLESELELARSPRIDGVAPRTHRGRETTGPMVKATFIDREGIARKVYVYFGLDDSGRPVEVFVLDERGSDDGRVYAAALGRLLSTALKYGVPLDDIVRALQQLSGGSTSYSPEGIYSSVPDMIARHLTTYASSLEEHQVEEEEEEEEVTLADEVTGPRRGIIRAEAKVTIVEDDPPKAGGKQCPACRKSTVFVSGGCPICTTCGWSKCG